MKKTFTLAAALLMTLGMTAQDNTKTDSLTIGDYDTLLETGDDYDTHQGSYWDRSPTTFYLHHTGSQIIYPKTDVEALTGKAITALKFAYFNSAAHQDITRTVNVYMKEVAADGFAYNEDKKCYQFFEYADGTHAANDYAFGCYFAGTLAASGEITIPLDRPFSYTGKGNLLVTLTFDGDGNDDNACNSLDLGFFFVKDRKTNAMTYTSDNYPYSTYAQTEDWPNKVTGCSNRIEMPVTRFLYTNGTVDAIEAPTHPTHPTPSVTTLHNLQGQRVGKGYRGIVVSGGKKIVNKQATH